MSSSLLHRTTISRSFSHKVQTLCTFTPIASYSSLQRRAALNPSTAVRALPSPTPSTALVRCQSTVPGNGPVRPAERPVSPHVTIYKFPIAAISSITNRVTGSVLTVGVIGTALFALGGACNIPAYTACLHSYPILLPVVKITFAFPVVYHYLAGLRHLFWDSTAKGLDLPAVALSTQVLFGSSAIITLLLAFTSI